MSLKTVAFLHTVSKLAEEKIKIPIAFTVADKIKYLEINLTEELTNPAMKTRKC